MFDQNKFAKGIAMQEGLKEQISIAQVKEVQRIILCELAKLTDYELMILLNRVAKKHHIERP